MSMKIPLTPAGIEPATIRFVAQHLTHCATAIRRREEIITIGLTGIGCEYVVEFNYLKLW